MMHIIINVLRDLRVKLANVISSFECRLIIISHKLEALSFKSDKTRFIQWLNFDLFWTIDSGDIDMASLDCITHCNVVHWVHISGWSPAICIIFDVQNDLETPILTFLLEKSLMTLQLNFNLLAIFRESFNRHLNSALLPNETLAIAHRTGLSD